MGGIDALIDTVESWLVRQDYWVQIPILLAVLLPVAWLSAGLIDRLIERVLRPRSRREARISAVHPAGRAGHPDGR